MRVCTVQMGVLALFATLAVLQTCQAQMMKKSYIGEYNKNRCTADILYMPGTTQEVAAIVKKHYADSLQTNGKITLRVSHEIFYTMSTFNCPITPVGSAPAAVAPDGSTSARVGLLTNKLNKVLATDAKAYTLRVGAGMKVKELQQAATKASMSVPVGPLPAFVDLTLSGLLSTSAHGSGYLTKSAFADAVLEVTWVDGMGEVHVTKRGDPDFSGFSGGLGSYYIITELLLQLTPPTATRVTTVTMSDANMLQDLQKLLEQSPHMCVLWQPDAGQFRAFMLTEVPVNSSDVVPEAQANLFPDLYKFKDQALLRVLGTAFNAWANATNDDSSFGNFACPQLPFLGKIGMWWAQVNGENKENVTGPTNNMQASDCGKGCYWSAALGGFRNFMNASFHDVEFTIEFDQLGSWINDIKRVIDVELRESGNASYRCMGLGIVPLRFGQPDPSGLTSLGSGLKSPVHVEQIWFRPRNIPNRPIPYGFVADLIEELTLCKYGGRPHFGKNFDRTFTHPKCPIAAKYGQLDTLAQLQSTYDPKQLFRNSLLNKVIKKTPYALTSKCALNLQCYCTRDSHCADGFKCVKSLAFPEYKLCKSPMVDIPGSIMSQVLG